MKPTSNSDNFKSFKKDIRSVYPDYEKDILDVFAKHHIRVLNSEYVDEQDPKFSDLRKIPRFSHKIRAVHIFSIPISDVESRIAMRTKPGLTPIDTLTFGEYSTKVKIIYFKAIAQMNVSPHRKVYLQQIMAIIKSD